MRLGKDKTDWFSLDVGLRQGCILSPTLFSIFIDSLARKVRKVGGIRYSNVNVSLLLFADDIVLMAESEENLQKMLDVVAEHSRLFRFLFNKDKSNVMIFGQAKNSVNRQKFYLGQDELKIVDKHKYLGMWLDQTFSWTLRAQKKMSGIFGLG